MERELNDAMKQASTAVAAHEALRKELSAAQTRAFKAASEVDAMKVKLKAISAHTHENEHFSWDNHESEIRAPIDSYQVKNKQSVGNAATVHELEQRLEEAEQEINRLRREKEQEAKESADKIESIIAEFRDRIAAAEATTALTRFESKLRTADLARSCCTLAESLAAADRKLEHCENNNGHKDLTDAASTVLGC